MIFKAFATIALSAVASAAGVSKQASYPFASQGDISLVYASGGGDSRLYYQQSSGVIAEYSINGPFDVGHVYGTVVPQPVAPASEVAQRSPISATILSSASAAYQEIHVFFVSPSGILSEYYWTGSRWTGGVSCGSACVTSLGIQVNTNTVAPTANQDGNNAFLTVTYVDAKNPGTLTQAIRRNGVWNTTVSTLH